MFVVEINGEVQQQKRYLIKRMGFAQDQLERKPSAKIRITEKLNWADIILLMEKKHKERIQIKFRNQLENKPVEILDIKDNYQYMDSELIEILEASVTVILNKYI